MSTNSIGRFGNNLKAAQDPEMPAIIRNKKNSSPKPIRDNSLPHFASPLKKHNIRRGGE